MSYIQKNSRLRILQTNPLVLHTWIFYSNLTTEERLFTKLFDKRDDFSFAIINFPFLCGNIPAAPAYGVYISQLVRYSRACGLYNDFLDRAWILTNKLLRQGFVAERLKSSLQKFFGFVCCLSLFFVFPWLSPVCWIFCFDIWFGLLVFGFSFFLELT